ncbi:MAG: type II CAAX endopeptidase family protein [Alphaproteobacteria bacterium]|nr:type II CAAX endopeptidase family protein [Alphaproteobacteria bacterium]
MTQKVGEVTSQEPAEESSAEGLTFQVLLLVTLVIAGLFFTLTLAIYWFDTPQTPVERALGLSEIGFLAGLLAQNVAIFGSLYGVLVWWRGISWRDLGLRPARKKWLKTTGLIILVFFPLTLALEMAMEHFLGFSFKNLALGIYAPYGFSWLSASGLIVIGGMMAPVAEELYFRGILYGWMRCRWSPTVGMLASSAIFAGIHMQPQVMPEIFLVGVILAWFYERSGSLVPGILLHMAMNILALTWLFSSLAMGEG